MRSPFLFVMIVKVMTGYYEMPKEEDTTLYDHIKEELGWDSLPSPSNTWSIVCDEVPEGYQWYVYPENYPLSACGVWNIFFTKEMDDIYDILEKAGFTNLSKSCVCH